MFLRLTIQYTDVTEPVPAEYRSLGMAGMLDLLRERPGPSDAVCIMPEDRFVAEFVRQWARGQLHEYRRPPWGMGAAEDEEEARTFPMRRVRHSS